MATPKYQVLDSLRGRDGKSSYEIWISQGNTGTEQDFLNSLKGSGGITGTTKTKNSLTFGDTLFKGDEVIFDIDTGKLLEYFIKEPIWTHIYLVNKDTNNGFRFACYVKHIYDKRNANNVLQEKKYVIDIQVHYIESDTKQFILENSIPVVVTYSLGIIPTPSFPNGVQTTYSFVNNIKDISNLYIHYTNSLKENNAGEGFIGGVTAQKVGEVQDTLVNNQDGVETPINDYVKVKDDKFVKVVDNVEKLLPINEETDKKLDELEDKINGSHIVNISKFALNPNTNTWYTDNEIKSVTDESNGARYVVNTNDGLYYYEYNDITENVGIIKGNSAFKEKTVNGKLQYTSNQVSTVREGTPLRVDKSVKGLSAVSFDLYMTGLGSTNRYYPEIAFVVNEGRRIAIETQFSCYDSSFQLKILRKDRNPITVASLPYSNGIFNANVKIEIKNLTFTAYINGASYSTSIAEICPELTDFGNLENVYFGLRYDTTPPTNWGFSNVIFEKKYWEQGYKIQKDTLYVHLADKSLYRYTMDTNTKPYPNFIKMTLNPDKLDEDITGLKDKVDKLKEQPATTDGTVYVKSDKAVYDKQGETKQLDVSHLSDETGLLGQGGGTIGGEKVIHITEYTTENNNIISFSMQGYSHFQMIHSRIDTGSDIVESIGFPTKKDDTTFTIAYCNTKNDINYKGGSTLQTSYENMSDTVFIKMGQSGLSVSAYIRLFNVALDTNTFSKGLEYTLSDDGTYYTVSGIGTCTDTDIIIPSSVGNPVKKVRYSAFEDCDSLTSVVIGDSVTSIGDDAFRDCDSLTSVVIGNSVTSIGGSAFYSCNSLAKVNYTGTIDEWAQINFGNINANPLYYAKNLYINDTLVTNVVLTTATKISDYAFEECDSLTSIVIGDSVTSIGYRAFDKCSSLTSIVIPDSVTSIGEHAFMDCRNLTSVVIGNSVTSIDDYAFAFCTSLTSVVIGNSVTSIDNYAFVGCGSLTSVTLLSTTPPAIYTSGTFNKEYVSKIIVPKGCGNAYKSATNWSAYADMIVEAE